MNFGAFAGGASQGFMNGVKMGKTLQEIAQERGIQDLRTKGMEEAEAMRAKTAAGMIKEGGVTGQPAETPKAAPEGPSAVPVEAAAPAPTPESPTASPDAASAATAASSGQPSAAPSVSTQAPAEAKPAVVQATPQAAAGGMPAPATPKPVEAAAPEAPAQPKGNFFVEGVGYETRDQALEAANKLVPSKMDFFRKAAVPKIAEAYIAQGNPEKAKAWTDYSDSERGKEVMRAYARTTTAPDLESMATEGVKLYNLVNDGVDAVGQPKLVTKPDGTQVAVVTLKNKGSGKTSEMEMTKEGIMRMAGSANPQALFEHDLKTVDAANKLKAEATLKAQQRKVDMADKKELEDYKSKNRMEEIGLKAKLKDDLGEDGAARYKKATSPEERAAILDTKLSDSTHPDYKEYKKLDKAQKEQFVLEKMRGYDSIAKKYSNQEAAPAAAPNPNTIYKNNKTGERFRIVDGKQVPVPPAQATPAAGGMPQQK